jgi:2-amino-4-hydroxy-6-hydroxymethyldihydropteridine diphosphokinase
LTLIVFSQYMNKAYLLIGGNTGQREQFLQKAVDNLDAICGHIIKKSSVYKTAAWGKTDQSPFLNQALLLQTRFNAAELMTQILLIEEKMGRTRNEKYAPRIIDIDVLLFNKEVIESTLIQVPHPQLPYRRFALLPLQEIAPRYQHPVLNKTIAQLLKECPDQLEVRKRYEQ